MPGAGSTELKKTQPEQVNSTGDCDSTAVLVRKGMGRLWGVQERKACPCLADSGRGGGGCI